MDWNAHRAHQLTRPAREGLEELVRELAPRSRVVNIRRLGGGLATATHAMDLRAKSGRVLRIVLKRYARGDVTPSHEWDRLTFARDLPLPTPDPMALDLSGLWFGTPALAMSRLPGGPLVEPPGLDHWLEQMARTLVTIQETPIRKVPAIIRRPHTVDGWKPSGDLRRSPLISSAIDAIDRNLPEAINAERSFGHGDYHPGNLVWARGRLTGVVDWSSARIGPRAYDVAYCRTDLTILVGADAAARFLEKYERALGRALGEDLWVWDLMCALEAVRSGRYWVSAYREQGRTDLTARHVWPRAATLIRNALDHV